jgi:hypothetical protein
MKASQGRLKALLMARSKYRPTARESALLLLALFEKRAAERGRLTRVRFGGLTLRRIANRSVLPPDFVAEVADWLHGAGWLLFAVASTGYGAVRVDSLRNWPTVASRSVGDTLDEVFSGRCDFADLEHLIPDLEDIDERGEQPPEEIIPSRDPP